MTQVQTELSRDLSLFDITMIGVGAMIGAGIFVLTGIAAGAAGPALILAFALNGVITIFTAMVYAELGSAIPEAGGGYLWVREGLPGPNAFLAGWMSWFAHAVAGSLYALGFGSYLALVLTELQVPLGGLQGELVHKGLAVVIILFFVAINFRGVSETGTAGNIVTVLKVIILLIFIASGMWAIFLHPAFFSKFQNFAPNGWTGIISAMGLTFIAFEGYEIIVQAGEEVKDPRRTLPKAVFLSLAIVVPIYMLVAFVSIGAVDPGPNTATYQWLAQHAELGVAEAAKQFMPFGTLLLLIGGLLSTMSALNATTFSSTRVSFAMGRDKNLPNAFAAIHPLTRTPYKALLFSGALILIMAVAIPIQDVAAAADIMFLLLFLQVNLAAITVRRKYGDRLRYGYLMPFFPIVPILGIGAEFFLAVFMFNFSPLAWYFAIAWLIIGVAIFYFYARPRIQSRTRTPVILQEKRLIATEEPRYTVLVPIANPGSLSILLKPAIAAARNNEGKIILLHVITVPEALPLSAGRQYVEQSRSLTNQALEFVEAEDVPAEVVVRIAHQPAEAIIHTTYERRIDLLIMGWRGQMRTGNTHIGHNVDRIIEEVNCEVLVIQQTKEPPFKHFLIPIADPLQTKQSIKSARLLACNGDFAIDVLHIFTSDTPESRRKQYIDALQLQIDGMKADYPYLDGDVIKLNAVEANDFIPSIVTAARGHDCVVLGTTRDSWLKQRLFGNKSAQIASQVQTPVMLVGTKTNPVGFGVYRLLRYIRGGYRRIEPTAEKELLEQGILLPPSERKVGPRSAPANQRMILIVAILALAAILTMYLGYGTLLTWIGGILFLVALAAFTRLSMDDVKDRPS